MRERDGKKGGRVEEHGGREAWIDGRGKEEKERREREVEKGERTEEAVRRRRAERGKDGTDGGRERE